jgi:autotransporter strand-loop-strand O-heptosyltransferase
VTVAVDRNTLAGAPSVDLKRVEVGEAATAAGAALAPSSALASGLAPEDSAAASAQSAAPQPPAKPAYPAPAAVPTQEGPDGLRFDFNNGCRLALPASEHPWRVRLSDLYTGNVLFEKEMKSGGMVSGKRYFIPFRLEVLQRDRMVMRHDYSAAGREVMIQFPVGTLGDPLGWFPYAVKFKDRHGCRLTCAMGENLISLLRDTHPDITFVTHEEVKPERYYATYNIGLFFDDDNFLRQPSDFRHVGLHRTAGYILGVDPTEVPPRIKIDDGGRPIPEPYVCIAVQSTTQAKYWNNPNGWRELVAFIKEAGYRVVCIDQKPVHGQGLIWNHIPHGAEDQTGARPLAERARWIKHAAFFVGLSSGLAWLAWAAGTPVVMISGFTHPTNEFATDYRVINYHTCNGCWNDVRHRFDHKDFLWCPRHANTPRQFECTRLITADQVKAVIQTIPGFGSPQPKPHAQG